MSQQTLHALNFVLKGLSRCGVDTATLLRKFGISKDAMGKQTTPVSSNLWCEMLDEAVRQTGDPDLGLKANQKVDLADYGPLGFAILHAENLDQALKVLISYIGLSQAGLELTCNIAKGLCVLEARNTDWRVPVHRTNIDWSVGSGIAFIRAWCGQDWTPDEVHVMYAEPKDTAIYQQVIGCPVYFSSPSNCLVFKATLLEKTKPEADPRLFAILRHDLDRLLEESIAATEEQHELITEVQTEIARLLCSGAPTIDQVAARMNKSARTLQRHLADKGYAFKALVEATRFQLAKNYLKSGHYSLIDIAFLLGYSELSAFSRAFRRWSGQTPIQYLKQLATAH